MKRILFALVLVLFAAGQVSAQMSDEEVVAFAKEQHEAGKSPTAILLELQKKGVKKEQLLRLKAQYESAQSAGGLTIADASASAGVGDRIRQTNGDSQSRSGVTDVAPIARNTTNGMQIFGHDIFQSDKLSFEPNMNIATPASYVLGPGDEVLIDIYGTSQRDRKSVV